MKSVILTSVAVLSLASLTQAQVYASDDFNYSGALTANGWVAHSGAGNKVIMANGSEARLDQSGGSGEDVNMSFAPVGATDTTYASFDFRLPSGNTVNPDGSGLYFAHLKDSGFAFRARTGVLSSAGGGGDFILAVNGNSSNLGAGTSWATELSFDTFYKVVISWNASTGEAKLWLNPVDMSSTNIAHTGTSTGDLMEAFALRQSNDYTGFIDVDNAVVGKTFSDVLPSVPAAYCTAGTSASGCQTFISATGTPSATATSGFVITGPNSEGNKSGLFYYAPTVKNPASMVGNSSSWNCVLPPVKRSQLLIGGGNVGVCDGTFSLDLNMRWTSKPAHVFPSGTTLYGQFWYRDPLNSSNQTTSRSDGLTWDVTP